MDKPIRVGMLGLGQRGLQHLQALWRLQEEGLAQIVALGDAFAENVTETKLQQYIPNFTADGINLTTDSDLLVNGSAELDALYICIPPNVHRNEVIRAAQNGIHLFVEKPMSLFLDEAKAMEAAIQAAGVLSTVGFQQRFDSRHEAIQRFLADKQVVAASYMRHDALEGHSAKHHRTEQDGGPSNRVWTANWSWSGGTVVEGGIHPLDLWRYWFGDVVWVQATYVHRPPQAVIDGADNPYAYTATFGFENGAIGTLNLSRLRRVFRSEGHHMILWEEGHVALEGKEAAVYHYDGPYPPSEKPDGNTFRRVLPQSEIINTTPSATYAIARTFLGAIADNDPTQIRSSFSDGMNSLAAVLAANVSDHLEGQRVYLDQLLNDEAYARFRVKPEASLP